MRKFVHVHQSLVLRLKNLHLKLLYPSSQNGTFVVHVPVGTYSEPFLYQLFCLRAIYGNC